jgi:Ser/Thr protein kinase RdoA (MazF antagonist)
MVHVSRRSLDEAAARFRLDPSGLTPMKRDGAPDGAVFRCGRDGLDAYLKIKPVTADRLEGERDKIDVQEHLRGHVGVITYLPSRDGALLEVIDDDVTYVATLSERASGRHPRIPEDFTPAFVQSWAGGLGRMHAVLRAYDGGTHLQTWRDEHTSFLAGRGDDATKRVWCELGDALAELPTGPDDYGIVHNDLHVGNLLIDDDGLTFLDFDVCSQHWFATDLAIVLAHPIWDLRRGAPGRIQPFVDTVRETYTAQYPLDASWWQHMPVLMRYRMALLVLAMADELGDQPRPPWLDGIRTWVLSGEPIADIRW